MVKIIHSGDFHFDSPFLGFPSEVGKIRSAEQLATFKKIIEYTKSENADILLLAGDIFENEYVSYKTVEFLKRCFAEIPDTYVFISPGNHDCISGNQVYTNIDFGENVVVFSPEIDFVEIPGLNTRIYGYGLFSISDSVNLGENMPTLDKSFLNIFLVHAALPPYSDTSPITKEEISESGFDLIASGHIHIYEGEQKYGDTYAIYPGMPEGRHFKKAECGEKGFLKILISKDNFETEFIKSSIRTNEKCEIDVSDCFLISDIFEKLSAFDKKNLYEFILVGNVSENVFFDIKALEKLLNESFFYAKVTDNTTRVQSKKLSAAEQMFYDILKKSDKSEKVIQRAFEIGLSAIRGEEIKGEN